MIIYRCDRCKKDADCVREIAIRGVNFPPEAQYQKPESWQICSDCYEHLRHFLRTVMVNFLDVPVACSEADQRREEVRTRTPDWKLAR